MTPGSSLRSSSIRRAQPVLVGRDGGHRGRQSIATGRTGGEVAGGEVRQEVHRGGRSGHQLVGKRAELEPLRHRVGRGHQLVGAQWLEHLGARRQHAAVGAEELVRRAGVEVRAEGRHVDQRVRGGVDAVDVEQGAGRVRAVRDRGHVGHRPDQVGGGRDGDDPGPRTERLLDLRRGRARRSRGRSRPSAPSRRRPRPPAPTSGRWSRGRGGSPRPRPPDPSPWPASGPCPWSAASSTGRRSRRPGRRRGGPRGPRGRPRRRPRRCARRASPRPRLASGRDEHVVDRLGHDVGGLGARPARRSGRRRCRDRPSAAGSGTGPGRRRSSTRSAP